MAIYDDLGTRYGAKFRMFATAVAGERALAAAAGIPPTNAKRWSRADQFRSAFLSEARIELSRYAQELMGNAQQEALGTTLGRLASTWADIADLTGQIVTQSTRQATFGLQNPLTVLQSSRMGAGAIGVLAQQRLANPTFKVRDSAGREWNGDLLMERIVRDFAYQVFIDHQFEQARQDGAQEVVLQHPDSTHPLAGETLPVTGEDWLQKRNEVFHFNSKLTVDHAVV
jgi:hypothetical protein